MTCCENEREEHAGPTLLVRFVWSLVLNAGLALGEIVMSLITGSTALLADGLNNLDDVLALVLSIYGERVARKPPDEHRTFGYERMDVVTGFAKGCFLLVTAVLVVFKAVSFLISPTEIAGLPVLITATIALGVNLITAFWLKQDCGCSLNARGTYLCMVYDAVGSASVMVSAVLTMLFGFVYFDIAASALIAFFMTRSGVELLRESINIFMQSAPEGFDYDAFEEAVLAIPGVQAVGDIHVWSHAPAEQHLTCRVGIEEAEACHCDRITRAVEELCQKRFGIQHSTVQLVYDTAEIARFCKRG